MTMPAVTRCPRKRVNSTGVLALIVVIRTFLSFSLELEITGRWPWQLKNVEDSTKA